MAQTEDAKAYADDTTITDILGDHPRAKILTVLLSEAPNDINITDIARLAGLERKTVYSHLDPLLAYGIVEKSRMVGNSTMYRINTDNEAAKALGKLDRELMQILAAKEDAGELDEEGTPIVTES
ncbi:winged helix-turn-helix domain-containing protein [Natrinema salinisoli]|uniref:winged helix-turn-helix domain-containing protein n=1 Tax=Natrinema salinisoli TaxID=2878535 RepID=UPI001CF0A413|nr:winged helix-turn-helix domain-containing protein [Natrinema salinisoli]